MIDPRFANAGATPFASGYGAQQMPVYHHHHRHHRHHKSNHGQLGASPLSRDESIHKVDHGHHHHFQQNGGAAFGGGFGVPYGAGGAGVGGAGGFYQQQQSGGGNFGYNNQHQGNAYANGQFGGVSAGPTAKHHRRHHRHHRHHGAEALGANLVGDQGYTVPEQLIGRRSSSVIGNEAQRKRSPVLSGESEPQGGQLIHHRNHHHYHHSGGHAGFGQTHQSRQTNAHRGHTSAASDGYGHINHELIFIERGEHSPHRQEPPPGYEYRGKIEVQGIDKEYHSQSHGQNTFVPPPAVLIPQPVAPPPSSGPCPPGWQQMVLTAAPGGPCPPGGAAYTGHLVGTSGGAHAFVGGIGGFSGSAGGSGYGGVGPIGSAGSGGGLENLAASLPFPPQGQLIADYIVESTAGGINSSGGSGFGAGYQQSGGGGGFGEQFHGQQVEERISGRTTIIEVWQKRAKSETRERSRSHSHSRSPKPHSSFDFDRFRNEILAAIERIVQRPGSPGGKIQWHGHHGGTQTEIRPGTEDSEGRRTPERRPAGEVRVIVQPIQPVFYMPRQTEGTSGPTQIGPHPPIQQPAAAPQVVYVPRNVYVPVIKPVFVPRERVIIRPQVIHVARPVLVDRPVPVTQRPIIIDRERPIPVPVRGAAQGGAQSGSRVIREEYVYRDNLPVAYGGRCSEYAGGVNYGYMPTQQEHQYAASSTHEVASGYQAQGPVFEVTAPNQFQHSQSASQLNVQQGGSGVHGLYSNLAPSNSASAVNAASSHRATQIEVLDSTVNCTWERTDESALVRRYGPPAYDIVHKTDQVEQQMYHELRQRDSSSGVQRSASGVSYGSSSGVGVNSGGVAASGGSFSSIPLGDIQNFNPEGIPHHGPAPIPIRINY